ncbi:MAG: Microtubule-associated protein, microtubule dynamics during spindle orientation [Vezdaea aestivalis]|nr:MAG: Microtubule-associated protein, microtubule dynamics during spindle orientation [Vezdaea aestivalis]
MAEKEEDFKSLPLSDRFTHKVWKVRKEAYEDAAKEFEKTPDESDPAFRPFLSDPSLFKGAAADSNVAAQQEGISALCSFLQYGGRDACIRTRGSTVSALVEKGLTSTRAATKSKSLEAILLYIELDKADPVIEDLMPALSHKQPKLIAATLNALTAVYHNYGCKTVDPKPTLKALPKVFGHADKNVRAEAQNLAVELYRWLREAMKPIFWGDLKPVQQTDLEALFEKAKAETPAKQERLLRSQQAAKEKAAAITEGPGEEDGESDVAEDEPMDLMEPVDVMGKVPSGLHEQLASTKWKDRKEALDALYAAVNVPRIKDGDFADIVRALAKCMKDANVAVVTIAANCIEVLAIGLRHGFAKFRSAVLGSIMERLKEKKQAVTDALGRALDAVFGSTGLTDCLEEILECLKHKNPQVKLESLRFLIRCLRTTKTVPAKPEVKSIADAALKLLTESSEALRSGAAETLGTTMKIMGERTMGPYLDGLDDIRKAKIKEFFDTAEVKAKDKPKPPAAAAPPKALTSKRVVGKKPVSTVKKPVAAAPPPAEAPTPLQTKPTARSIPSKIGGPRSGLAAPGSGLRLQKKLTGPGGAPAPQLASPRRPQPPPQEDEEAPAPPPAKPGLGRGLAGRPLGKPSAAPASPPPDSAPVHSGLSVVERAELDELRTDRDRLRRVSEDLRSERSKMQSQIHELQNQNAQLIEDHTRDVLSIKAKETQLVRARSDAETAEQIVQKQTREIERLKRELSRAVRATSPAPADVSEQIYRDAAMHSGAGGEGPRSGYVGGGYGAYGRGGNKRMSFASQMSEEKENGGIDAAAYRSTKMSPPMSGLSSGAASGGRGSPISSREPREGTSTGGGTANGEGIESWRRAAEVTSQLKARIEQMKAKQGLSRS